MWRSIARLTAAALLVASGVVWFVHADVGGASCGSAFDAVTGRTGWEEWWARDLADPVDGAAGRLVRAEDCPGEVNARIVTAGVLAGVAAAVAIAGEAVGRGRMALSTVQSPAERIERLGTVLSWVGAALTLAGVVAIVVLVADPDSTLFLYVDRLVVAIIGGIVLVPAVALVFGARAMSLAGRHLVERERGDAAT